MTAVDRVRAALLPHADPAVKEGMQRYFKQRHPFHGVKAVHIHAVARATLPPSGDGEALLGAAGELLAAPFMEERQVGALWLRARERQLPPDLVARLAPLVDLTVDNWAVADALSGGVLRRRVFRVPAERTELRTWVHAPSAWRRRMVAVTYTNEARTGRYDAEILEVVGALLGDHERFVQLGIGWLMRELSVSDRPRAVRYLLDHLDGFSREGLRYAVEKLPPEERRSVMAAPRARG